MAQLRLAVTMRGGGSLAVRIGGALAEIDVMRSALDDGKPGDGRPALAWSDPNEEVYSLLLRLAGHSSVQVDVLSGASAGGLNGAIYVASLIYGFDFCHMLPIWVRLADPEFSDGHGRALLVSWWVRDLTGSPSVTAGWRPEGVGRARVSVDRRARVDRFACHGWTGCANRVVQT